MSKIVIAPKFLKYKILTEKYKDESIQFFSKEEFINKFTFESNIYSIFECYKKYCDTFKMQNFNLFYKQIKTLKKVYNFNYNSEHVNKLFEINEFLMKNNLLDYDQDFIEFAKKVNIDIYLYDRSVDIDLYKLLNNYQLRYKECLIDPIEKSKIHLRKFNNNKIEIGYVLNSIFDLLKSKNATQNDICLICPSTYNCDLLEVSQLFKLNLKIEKDNLFSNSYISEFYNNLSKSSIDEFIQKYDEKNSDIFDNYLYTFILEAKQLKLDVLQTKDYLYYRIKNISLTNKNNVYFDIFNSVDDVNKDYKYIFMIGFNSDFESSFKDCEYLTDEELKNVSYMMCSTERKKESDIKIIKFIQHNNIHHLSYSDNSVMGECHEISLLTSYPQLFDCNIENLTNIIETGGTFYSEDFIRFYVAEKLHDFDLFGTKSDFVYQLKDDLNVRYDCFDNSFKCKKPIITNEQIFSTTTMDSIDECPFSFYIKKYVLKDSFNETLQLNRGNYIHKLLETLYSSQNTPKINDVNSANFKIFQENFIDNLFSKVDIKDYYLSNDLISNTFLNLTNDNIRPMLRFHLKLKSKLADLGFKFLTEKEVELKIDNIDLKGKVDLIIYRNSSDENSNSQNDDLGNIAFIIDFKTGNAKNIYSKNELLSSQLQTYQYFFEKKLKDELNCELMTCSLDEIYKLNKTVSNKDNIYKNDTLDFFGFDKSKTYLEGDKEKLEKLNKLLNIMPEIQANKDYFDIFTEGKFHFDNINNSLTNFEDKCKESYRLVKDNRFDVAPKTVQSCRYCHFKDICFMKPSNIRIKIEEGEEDGE